ncbi:MAG TPA: PilZ domain-containing protein, partial [Desulfuromonadales bacterium]|nr:PilZ domain-containing protein [Desulfuromonadales bacterium]
QEGAEKSEITPGSIIVVPFELFDLFAFIQRQVENHPRQNLRLRLKLPGMYSIGDDEFLLADVLSLSMQGLFFKASSRLSKGDRITVVFPLFGQCKEIEVKASVLYTIQPEAENNFFQGFGVGFDDIPEELAEQLQIYIREYFLREVSASNDGVGNFTAGQLQN